MNQCFYDKSLKIQEGEWRHVADALISADVARATPTCRHVASVASLMIYHVPDVSRYPRDPTDLIALRDMSRGRCAPAVV